MEKTYVFNISVDAWIDYLPIEASSLEEAQEKLYKMSLEEIVEKGCVHDFEVEDVDVDYDENDEDEEEEEDE